MSMSMSQYYGHQYSTANTVFADCAVEQEFKEAMMAYFVMWRWGKPITSSQLDAACEYVFKKCFDSVVDFEVDDALAKYAP